jgi:hypothetical protein
MKMKTLGAVSALALTFGATSAMAECGEVVLDFRPVCSLVKMDQGFI